MTQTPRILCLFCAPLNHKFATHIDNFITSYLNHPSGLKHDFLVIYKSNDYNNQFNWPEGLLITETGSKRLGEIPHQYVVHYQLGLDIGSYLYCIQEDSRWSGYDYYMCISTTSILYADHWLAKMIHPFLTASTNHKVGVVGACGSWQHAVHIRTDFFMVPRQFFIDCHFPPVQDKNGGYQFELALSRVAHERGYQCLIVNQNGQSFRPWEYKQEGMFSHMDYWKNIISSDHRCRDLYTNPLNQHWVWTDSSPEPLRTAPAYL